MDNFFDSLEQKYAKKQKGSSKAGGSKNKTSGGKGTRNWKKDIVHDITVCVVVILCFCSNFPCACLHSCLIMMDNILKLHLKTCALKKTEQRA